MQIRTIAVSRINPAPYNPRIDLAPGDPEYEKLRRSVREFGLVEPLVWNQRTGNLVGGHQRFKVILESKPRSIEVSVVDLPLEKEKALNLALNKISGAWDDTKLAALLRELLDLPEFDLALTGFDSPEVAELLDSVDAWGQDKEETFDVEAELNCGGPVVTKPGELLILGKHRLLCGDCTDANAVRLLMDGVKADLFSTDPPYLVGYDGTNHPTTKARRNRGTSSKVATSKPAAHSAARTQPDGNKDWSDSYGVTWDDADANSDLYDRFLDVAVAEALKPDAAWYCWHASRRQAMLEQAWQRHGAFVHCQIIWVKNRPVLTRSWYSWQHEPCLMGWIQGNKPRRSERAIRPTVWCIDTLANGPDRPDHPTPKPLEVFEIPMQQHTKPADVCYEPFAGSGTQVIAAERLGRRCYACEISPRYCDLIVRRWIDFVGSARAPRALIERYRRGDDTVRAKPRAARAKERLPVGGGGDQ